MFDVPTLLMMAALATPPAPTPSANDSVLASVVSPLVRPGARLRVRSEHAVTEGAATLVDPFGLELQCAENDIWDRAHVQPFVWSQIDRIELRTRSADVPVKAGAAIGCMVGLALTLSVSVGAEKDGASLGAGGVLVGGALGGIAGACIGGILGGIANAASSPWTTIYERR